MTTMTSRSSLGEPCAQSALPGPTAVELEAMRLCAAGVGDGLETLHRLHAGSCLAVARRVLRDQHHAQDAVQEAFLDVWRHAQRYDGQRASPRSWLLTLTFRKAVDRLRRETLRSTLTLDDQRPIVDPAADCETQAIHRVDATLALRALHELPPAQAEVLVLAYWGGLTQVEIARVLGVPLGTVKTRARSGLAKLAVALGAHDSPGL